MTGIPVLPPPRKSPATAYLQHIQQKKIGKSMSNRTLLSNDEGSPQSVISRKMPLANLPRPTMSRNRSTGTYATCVTMCSDNSGGSSNTANSNSSLGEGEQIGFPLSFPDDFVASTGASATSTFETALVPRTNGSRLARDPPPLPAPVDSSTNLLMAVGDDDPTLNFLQLEVLDDDDSLVALDRLLAETSRRWSDYTKKTHREFCRLSSCPCRDQEIVIAQQAAEIALLREQLQQEEEEAFPLEQIEVYHDAEDHCSVTSGLTQHHDSASLATGQHLMHPQNRPDADSVTGTQSLHQPTPPAAPKFRPAQAKLRRTPPLPPSHNDSKPPLRALNRVVSLTAADGTTRQAIYTGDVSNAGELSGCGVLKFASGDYYMGQVQHGQMHGQGTFVVNRKSQKKQQLLTGHFEQNVFTGTG